MHYKTDPSQKFSGREDIYHKYRPDYPDEMIGFFYQEFGLDESSVIADIGSGTGKLSQYFVARSNKTYGVEINTDMRRKAKDNFASKPNFICVDGTAEKTTLPDNCIDLVTAAQAFHWFKPDEARQEFRRILKPDGNVALIWNIRQSDPFMDAYNELMKKSCPRYKQVGFNNYMNKESIKTFFGTKTPKEKMFDYSQYFDLKSLFGRALSASYVDEDNKTLFEKLENLFQEYNTNGTVTFSYRSHVIFDQF